MAVLELILLPWLSIQAPAPQAPVDSPGSTVAMAASDASVGGKSPAAQGQDPASTTKAPPGLVAALQAVENDQNPDLATVAELAGAGHAGIAARAAWLLGNQKRPEALPFLSELAGNSPHVDVRLQVMHALLRDANDATYQTAVNALDDEDVRVRTMAAQLLGKLQHEATATPLLAMLAVRGKGVQAGSPSSDLQAALLALGDTQDPTYLLPAAEAMNGCQAGDIGQALTYSFQRLSPNLSIEEETTLLIAVLDHSEAMLRRYAIGRLGDLRQAGTANALERRLAVEGDELRPLIEVALQHIRQPHAMTQNTGNAKASTTATGLWERMTTRWSTMSQTEQVTIFSLTGFCLLLMIAIPMVIRRQRRAQRHAQTAALVGPSEEYAESLAAEEDYLEGQEEPLEAAPEPVETTQQFETLEQTYEETEESFEAHEEISEEPEQQLETLEQTYEETEESFEAPEQTFEETEQQLETLEQSVEAPEELFEAPEQTFEETEQPFETLEEVIEETDQEFETLEQTQDDPIIDSEEVEGTWQPEGNGEESSDQDDSAAPSVDDFAGLSDQPDAIYTDEDNQRD